MTRLILMLALGVLSSSPDAAAQRLEIGGNASAILPVVSGDGPAVVAGGGPRVTINVAPWIAVELLAEALGPVEASSIFGVYGSQVKIPVKRSPDRGRMLSFTVGAVGAASYQRFPETRRVRFDGSTIVHPGYRRFRTSAPNALSLGVSGRHRFNRRAAGMWDLQALIGELSGIAARASFGVSFGIGGYR
jgi:hypothetical protein